MPKVRARTLELAQEGRRPPTQALKAPRKREITSTPHQLHRSDRALQTPRRTVPVSLLFREVQNTTLGIHTGVRYTRKDNPTHSLLAVKGLRPPRLRRVAVRGGGEEPRRGRGGERSGSDHHQTYRATRAGHPPNNTHPDQPPHSTPPYSDRDPTHPGLSQYSTLGTAQHWPISRGSCFYGGECTMKRSSSSRNCTRECYMEFCTLRRTEMDSKIK
jgi:hypothetical protein